MGFSKYKKFVQLGENVLLALKYKIFKGEEEEWGVKELGVELG